ncbi:MAG: N-6 DNA methylase [Planctomycetes bacterium]|nr:N-6 DNA methylase [Planctomycetota bacterium]
MPVQNRQRRKTHGVVYTPAPIVSHIVRQTLDVLLDKSLGSLRILDPACGDGAFVVHVYERLLRRYGERVEDSPPQRLTAAGIERRLAIARRHLFGIDIDDEAVAIARRRLASLAANQRHAEPIAAALRDNLVCGDALSPSTPPAPWLRPAGFSAIVCNPPYVGFRQLAKHHDKPSFTHGDGRSCDLYIRFIERIMELLIRGGRFGLIVPNKIAIADYAQSCRQLLLTQTRIERLDDVSALGVFPSVSVYPIILTGAKIAASPSHCVVTAKPRTLDELGAGRQWMIRQVEIDAAAGFPLRPPLDVESRAATRPLGDLVTVHSGATGFTAARLAEALVERHETAEPGWNFVTSGNIDRYAIRVGDVRFMGAAYRRPLLPTATAILTERKRRLYREPKIVVAGMTRRLEAAYAESSLALGVQVYAAANLREDPYYLLAVLNSKLLTFLFRGRFQAKRLAGGYFSLNKRQLEQLPIRAADGSDRRASCELSRIARRLSEAGGADEALDRRIDEIIYPLYRLTDEEVDAIEAELAELA